MQARMSNPAMIVPDAMQVLLALRRFAENGSVPSRTLALVHLRASRINGCSVSGTGAARLKQRASSWE